MIWRKRVLIKKKLNQKISYILSKWNKAFEIFLDDPRDWLQEWIELRREDNAKKKIISNIVHNGTKFRGERFIMVLVAALFAAGGLYKDNWAYTIGSMLASPMMYAIIGIAYALYAFDDDTFWGSFKSFMIQFAIGLGLSFCFFSIMSLNIPTDALWARTYPDAIDLSIAFAGGLLGILASMHADKISLATVVAAVAIGTSLMPPICTIGYGLATGQHIFIWDAFWLFVINTVMIMLASILMIYITELPKKQGISKNKQFVYGLIVCVGIVIAIINSLQVANYESNKGEIHTLVQTVLKDKGRMTSLDINHHQQFVDGFMVTNPLVTDTLWRALEQEISLIVPDYDVKITQVAQHHKDDRISSFAKQQNEELSSLRSQLKLSLKERSDMKRQNEYRDSIYTIIPSMLRRSIQNIEGVNVVSLQPEGVDSISYAALVKYAPKNWKSKVRIENDLDSLSLRFPKLSISKF